MNEQQKNVLDYITMMQRGNSIIEGTQLRADGYTNMLNKYGTKQDNSTAYQYMPENFADDMELVRLYEGNGLFTKIIDRPSEEAVKHGLDIDYGDNDIAEYVEERLDNLNFEEQFSTAEKWARLYGGSIIVMLVDDGRGLEEPLDWNNARSIEELRVFERSIVQPDYTSMNQFSFRASINSGRKIGEPEYYNVFSIYGYFTVHRSRCLVFRNGKLPEQTTNALYRYWGTPEYVKIKRALRECITTHENGPKLLERSVQAIYKMKNLANLLSTADGENKVLQRLQVIDMARGILNSIAIDTDGEEYDFKTTSMSGVKEIIDSTCNMLSAVTDIPQTILFGRSPAGMNSTGESDMENYYNMVEKIQKHNMKSNTRTVIDLILRQGYLEGQIKEVPKYKVKFAALWSMSDTEQADVDNKKAQTEYAKAQTAQIYMDSSVIDPSEVRKSLAFEGSMEIEEILSDEELDIPEDAFDLETNERGQIATTGETIRISGVDAGTDEEDNIVSIIEQEEDKDNVISIQETGRSIRIVTPDIQDMVNKTYKDADEEKYKASAVLIIKDGKILCAYRDNDEGICGPGGKIESGETTEEAAIREAMEEFNIVPLNLIPLGDYNSSSGSYLPTMIYFTDQFTGTPKADGEEMVNEQWLSMKELRTQNLFPPFKASLDILSELMKNYLTPKKSTDTIMSDKQDGGPGSGRYPKGSGKKNHKKGSLSISEKERAKVGHDINNVYHSRYKGKRSCFIRTRSNETDSPIYLYRFRNHGFDNYDIYNKEVDDN